MSGLFEGLNNRQTFLSAPNPSLRDRVGNAAYDLLKTLGLDVHANRVRNKTNNLSDFVPALGDAIGANDTYRDYQAGNYKGALINGGLTALGVVPVVGKAASKGIKQGIRAYHGSPHSLEKFSMDKIGTGEGVQAQGYGLYFNDTEKIGEKYRDRLSGREKLYDGEPPNWDDPATSAASWLENFGGDKDAAINYLKDINPRAAEILKNDEKLPVITSADGKGHLYEVNIDASPEDLLDWDAPFSKQPKAVQELAEKYNAKQSPSGLRESKGSEIYRTVGAAEAKPPFDTTRKSGNDIHATPVFRDSGVPGIKYQEIGALGKDEPSTSFVVFDENLISIVKKYGVAGAVGMGLVSQADGEAIAAQLGIQ